MKRLTKRGWIIAAVAVAGVVLCFFLFRGSIEVEVGEVVRGPVEQCVVEEAKTRLHTVREVSARTSGVAARIELEEGEAVTAGQVITSIDDAQLKALVQRAAAQIEEVKARLEGVDVTLPKKSQIEAAQKDADAAAQGLEMAGKGEGVAEANYKFAQKDLSRAEALVAKGTVAQEEYDRVERDCEVAKLELAAAELRVNASRAAADAARLRHQVLLESMDDTQHLRKVYAAQMEQSRGELDAIAAELAKTAVTSPIDGVVLEKYVDTDGPVSAGTRLLLVGDMDSIEIEADVLSEEVGAVEAGQKVHLTGRALPSGDFEGKVKKVYPSGFTKVSSLGVRQQRVKVLMEFDNSELRLGPGYELDVRIVTAARKDAVVVPAAAAFATPAGMSAFRIRRGRAEPVVLKIGIRGDESFEVLEGLRPGDRVILRPPRDMKPWDRVRPAEGR